MRLPSDTSASVAIIGGGIIGCMCAYYLTRAGMRDVVLIEAESIASGASGYSAGILTPYSGSNDPGLLSLSGFALELHRDLSEELPQITGVDHGYDLKPYLRCAFEEHGYEEARNFMDARAVEGHDVSWLSSDEAREMSEGWLSDEVTGACATSIEPTVDSRLLTDSAFKAAELSGARLVNGRVTGLVTAGGRVSGVVLDDGVRVFSDVVVLAMGPWSNAASDWLGVRIPVEPQKGELLYMHSPRGSLDDVDENKPPVGMHNMDDGGVILPRRLSRTVLGATKQECGYDREPSDYAWEFILPRVSRLSYKVSADSVTHHTACLRPMPADGKPYVGIVPSWEGVYIASGHWSEGVHYGPLTGKWIADVVVAGDSDYDISAISSARISEAGAAGHIQ